MALLDSRLALCERQSFISSGFTTPSLTPNASSQHSTGEISGVTNLQRKGKEGWSCSSAISEPSGAPAQAVLIQ